TGTGSVTQDTLLWRANGHGYMPNLSATPRDPYGFYGGVVRSLCIGAVPHTDPNTPVLFNVYTPDDEAALRAGFVVPSKSASLTTVDNSLKPVVETFVT